LHIISRDIQQLIIQSVIQVQRISGSPNFVTKVKQHYFLLLNYRRHDLETFKREVIFSIIFNIEIPLFFRDSLGEV
jgi:hypothetical protein